MLPRPLKIAGYNPSVKVFSEKGPEPFHGLINFGGKDFDANDLGRRLSIRRPK